MITASIVTYKHTYQEIETLLKSLRASEIAKVFVIDNSPSDALKVVSSISSKISYVFLNRNIGFGAAHNRAITEAFDVGSNYHVVLNPDVDFASEIISEMAQYMEANIDVGLIMPKIVYPDGQIQYLAKMLPTPFDWIGRRFIPFKGWINQRNHLYELRGSGYNKIMNVPYLSGCFMFIRTSVLQEVGLFDEGIFMYGEDTDLTRRIHTKFKTLFYPKVTVTHVHNKESYRNYRLLLIHIKAAIYYFNKWGWLFDIERKRINKQLKADYLTQ